MAGSRIAGITIEIGGDTTKLQDALKGVNTQIRDTQNNLKDVERLLKLDPSHTELLAQKQSLLKEKIGEKTWSVTNIAQRIWKGPENSDLNAVVNRYIAVGTVTNLT